jgi:hypothetical protein
MSDITTALCEHEQNVEAPVAAEVTPPQPEKTAPGLPPQEPPFNAAALDDGLVLPLEPLPFPTLPAFAGSADECSLPEKEVVYDDDLSEQLVVDRKAG